MFFDHGLLVLISIGTQKPEVYGNLYLKQIHFNFTVKSSNVKSGFLPLTFFLADVC